MNNTERKVSSFKMVSIGSSFGQIVNEDTLPTLPAYFTSPPSSRRSSGDCSEWMMTNQGGRNESVERSISPRKMEILCIGYLTISIEVGSG